MTFEPFSVYQLFRLPLLQGLARVILTLIPGFCSLNQSLAEENTPVVLILHSFTPTALWNRELNESFEENLKDLNAYIHYEQLNVNQFPDEHLLKEKSGILKYKYHPDSIVSRAVSTPDVIIAAGQPAMEFVINHPATFGNTPIIFSGIVRANNPERSWEKHPNSVTVFNAVDFKANAELISKLHPDRSEILIVIGNSKIGSGEYNNAINQLSDISIPQKITYILGSEYSTEEMVSLLEEKRDTAVVQFMNWTLDRNMENTDNPVMVGLISNEIRIPIYGQYSALIGKGIIGGHLVSARRQAVETTEVLKKILMGITPEDILQSDHGSRVLLFDYHELKKWSIDFDKLPKKSIIINQPNSIWTDYKEYVIVAILVFIFQCLAAVSLGVAFYFKRKMERMRRENEKNLGEELQRSNRLTQDLQKALETKSTFLAVMSHELRTPLNPIIGYSDLLLEKEQDEDTTNSLRSIQESAKNLLDLIDTVLQYVDHDTKSAVNIEAINVTELIDEIVVQKTEAASEKGLELHCNSEVKDHELIFSDRFLLEQILNKLISNAIKFTETGSISIRASLCKQDESSRAQLKLEIEDTGVGFSKEYQKNIFDAFSQMDTSPHRKFGGMGLGLSLAKKIVDSLNGTIAIESEENVGSRFTVLIPQHQTTSDESKGTAIDAFHPF